MKLNEVIVIDDSDPDLLYTKIILEAAAIAHNVRTFETAIDALAYLKRPEGHQVDAILLDINMPEMSGFEFLDAYSGLMTSQQAKAVVVMLTSSPHPADRARALAYDCVKGYVVKPIDVPGAQGVLALVQTLGDGNA
jgi:CheY-like chemotaxis protein